MKKDFTKIKRNRGAAMLISVVSFLFISLAIISGLVSSPIQEFKTANVNLNSKKSYFLAESGSEDAMYRLSNNLAISEEETINLDSHSATTTITTTAGNIKEISSLGDVLNHERKINLKLTTGVGVAFSYGVQVGAGGLTMGNNSVVQGSVYSNGRITGSGVITGSATSANSSALEANQTNNSGIPSHDIIFGKTNAEQDFAQSFQINTTGLVNKVELYLKKVSTPASLTVRIVSDQGGSPSTITIASGSLSASLISNSYGWVNVPFSANPELIAGTTYWIVIDGSYNSSKYYLIGANDNGYESGASKIGKYSGSWGSNDPAGLDGFFKLYLGGLTGLIDGITVGTGGVGNTYAHTVTDSNIAGTNYCQTGSGNNKICNTSLSDPIQIAMPISEQNILDWKSEAEAGGVYSGNYIAGDSSSLGPKKITGNLTVTNGAHLTMNGTLWVQGNIEVSNNAIVDLSPSYGTSEGVIVADGTINISNNATFSGSGSAGSYIMVLSASTSSSAINLANNGGAVILYAANGTVNLANNAGAKALNGKYINLSNNAVIIYDSGLVNSNFVSGPSGGWNLSVWKEAE